MEKLKYGLIGCGRISGNHLAAAIENGLEIVALCDIFPQAMDSLAASYGLADLPKYTDLNQMLASEDLDLVAITTKSSNHAEAALAAIAHGVNVIIEKPIALSLGDVDQIIEASQKMDVKVCSCHQNRYNKAIQKVRQALQAGDMGKMMYANAAVRWNRNREYYEQAAWRGTWAEDGGSLMNQCIHNIDLLRWMMGDAVTEVFAYTDQLVHDYIEAEDFGIALVRFASGGYGLIEGSTVTYPADLEETLGLFGTTGTVKIGGTSLNLIEHWQVQGSSESAQTLLAEYSEHPENIYGFGHVPLYADMIEAIETGREPYIDAQAGRNAIELVLAIYQSAALGEPVKLPLYDIKTTDFAGRFS